ncbi:maleylacetoacetate isomerase [Ixodes scapularis]
MSSKPILYSWYGSSCVYRVRIALALKKVDYEYKSVPLIKNRVQLAEQISEEFTRKNPMQQIPVLEADGNYICQSLAIIEFLEEKYPEPNLLPKDIVQRAKVRAIAELIVSGIQPLQNTGLLFRLEESRRKDWAVHFIVKGFKALETVLAKTAGQYCVGDSVTIADTCLVPQVYNAKKFGVDLTPYPTIVRINDALEELAAFKVAHPRCQPDTPGDYKVPWEK